MIVHLIQCLIVWLVVVRRFAGADVYGRDSVTLPQGNCDYKHILPPSAWNECKNLPQRR